MHSKATEQPWSLLQPQAVQAWLSTHEHQALEGTPASSRIPSNPNIKLQGNVN